LPRPRTHPRLYAFFPFYFMSVYIVAVTIAAFLQIGTIYLLRENILKSLAYAIPMILVYQILFLWSYSNAPKFTVIWFITTALTNSLAFLVGYLIWKEQVSVYNIIGIALIIAGVALLKFK